MHNVDAYLCSAYIHKDRDDIDGKLKFGPIWDNDLSLGNTNYRNRLDDWMFSHYAGSIEIIRIMGDKVFVKNMADRWHALRSNVYSDNNLLHFIDSVSNAIKESRIMNYKVWPLLSAPILWPSYIPPTYEFEIDTMKQWIVMRAAWMDNNIDKIHYSLPRSSIEENEINNLNHEISIYPVPFTDYINIKLTNNEEIDVVEIIDVTGRLIIQKSITPGNIGICKINGLDELQSGIYLISIKQENGKNCNRTIVKK
jgi:hypothetical protein